MHVCVCIRAEIEKLKEDHLPRNDLPAYDDNEVNMLHLLYIIFILIKYTNIYKQCNLLQ